MNIIPIVPPLKARDEGTDPYIFETGDKLNHGYQPTLLVKGRPRFGKWTPPLKARDDSRKSLEGLPGLVPGFLPRKEVHLPSAMGPLTLQGGGSVYW